MFAQEEGGDEIVSPYQAESRPTAIIDVVFLLLIFFMCSSSFPLLEQRLDTLLPKDKGANAATAPVTKQKLDEIVITVTASPRALRTPIFRIRGFETNNYDELYARLAQIKSIAKSAEEIPPVVIAGKPDCPFAHIIRAMDACAKANMTNIEFRPPMGGPEAGGSDSDHSLL
jgi:biopolymer transport protein ExbD